MTKVAYILVINAAVEEMTQLICYVFRRLAGVSGVWPVIPFDWAIV